MQDRSQNQYVTWGMATPERSKRLCGLVDGAMIGGWRPRSAFTRPCQQNRTPNTRPPPLLAPGARVSQQTRDLVDTFRSLISSGNRNTIVIHPWIPRTPPKIVPRFSLPSPLNTAASFHFRPTHLITVPLPLTLPPPHRLPLPPSYTTSLSTSAQSLECRLLLTYGGRLGVSQLAL